MKKILLSASVIAGLFAQPTIEELQKQIQMLQKELQQLKENQQKVEKKVEKQNERYYSKVSPIVSNTHLFLSFDLRTSYDRIEEKTSDYTDSNGNKHGEEKYSNSIFSNRIELIGVAQPAENLKANLVLQANNIFGMNRENGPFQNVSWISSETPDDTTVRVKEAYFNYWFGPDNGFMFSAGRRPATNGFPANLRENARAESTLAHLINLEFDGISFQIGNPIFAKLSDKFSDWGTWFKLCIGRGYSSSIGKWNSNLGLNYTKTDLKNMDFTSLIFVPYDDGQYSLKTETSFAWHVQGSQLDMATGKTTLKDFGNWFGTNAVFEANGIGDGISDFLDDSIAFISYSFTKTNTNGEYAYINTPEGNIQAKNHTGYSIWTGFDIPGFRDNDRFGLSFVHGSKYFRSFTYGEDTLVGSIAAIRGNAYDMYYHAQIIPHLTAGLRATYLDYQHPGSDYFFGINMDPDTYTKYNLPYVKKATDFRAYIRYNF
jgi:hypothetical protein